MKKDSRNYKGKYRQLTQLEKNFINEVEDMFKALCYEFLGFDRETTSERPYFEYYRKNSHFPYMPMYQSMLSVYKSFNMPKSLSSEQRDVIELIAYTFVKDNKLI